MSVDAPQTSANLRERLSLSYPILSDPDLAMIRAYGVEDTKNDIAKPTTYVIDARGVVRFAYVGKRPPDRPLVDDVIDVLKSIAQDDK